MRISKLPHCCSLLFPIVGLLMLCSGCATSRVDWAARVGSYTYDDVVLELGPPDKQATLTDGVRIADWLTRRGGSRYGPVFPYATGPYGYGINYPLYPDYQVPDYFLRLMFDPDGILMDWKNFARY